MGSASDTISQCRDPQSRSSDRTELRVRGRRTLLALGSAGVALLVLLDWGLGFPVRFPGTRTNGLAKGKPTIVLILTDDQRWDSLGVMPEVRKLLGGHGVTFANSFVTTSLCCPSRATILTGQYSRHTGVYQNTTPHGGATSFRDRSTVATWLHGAGYETALVGKYLNDYNRLPTGYVPPGWDEWDAIAQRRQVQYYNYDLNENGRIDPAPMVGRQGEQRFGIRVAEAEGDLADPAGQPGVRSRDRVGRSRAPLGLDPARHE